MISPEHGSSSMLDETGQRHSADGSLERSFEMLRSPAFSRYTKLDREEVELLTQEIKTQCHNRWEKLLNAPMNPELLSQAHIPMLSRHQKLDPHNSGHIAIDPIIPFYKLDGQGEYDRTQLCQLLIQILDRWILAARVLPTDWNKFAEFVATMRREFNLLSQELEDKPGEKLYLNTNVKTPVAIVLREADETIQNYFNTIRTLPPPSMSTADMPPEILEEYMKSLPRPVEEVPEDAVRSESLPRPTDNSDKLHRQV